MLLARAVQLWIAHIGCEQTWDDGAVQLARGIYYYARGGPMYTDFRRPPFYALEYGPTIPALVAPLTKVVGSSVFACLRTGRALTILITVAVFLTMMALARRFSSWLGSEVAVLGFALAPVFFPTFSEFRVDMPALLSELAGLYAFSAGVELIALLAFTLAFLTKPTYVAGIAAVVGLEWWQGNRRHAVRLALGMAGYGGSGADRHSMAQSILSAQHDCFPCPPLGPDGTASIARAGGVLDVAALVLAGAGLRHPSPAMKLSRRIRSGCIRHLRRRASTALGQRPELLHRIRRRNHYPVGRRLRPELSASRSLSSSWQAAIGIAWP